MRGGVEVTLLPMTTRGDQILDRSLSKVGGKGLFVKELENALADRRADLAVHSLKDVPMDLPAGFALAAVLEREDARDAWVSNRYAALADLPQGAVVGTSSLRRVVQLAALRPDLRLEPLRGNLDTRLRKLDEGGYDAIVLAAAGLVRLGLADRIRARFAATEMLPCAGQGALAIETRADDAALIARLEALTDRATRLAVAAERAVSRALGGSCSMPLAAHAALARRRCCELDAAVGHPEQRTAPLLRARSAGAVDDERAAEALGRRAAEVAARGRRGALPRRRGTTRRERRPAVTTARPARVLVTRPAAQAEPWVERLRERGIVAEALPLIEIAPRADASALRSAWAGLATCRLVVFVSANAVLHFFAERPAGARLARRRRGRRARQRHRRRAARGRRAGRRRSSTPAADAAQFDSESLWARLHGRDWRGARVLVVRGDGGRDWLAERLRRRRRAGRHGERVPAPRAELRRRRRAIASTPRSPTATRVWLFSSSEAIANLEQAAGAGRCRRARARSRPIRASPARARSLGFGVVVEAAPGLDAVIACIQSMQP